MPIVFGGVLLGATYFENRTKAAQVGIVLDGTVLGSGCVAGSDDHGKSWIKCPPMIVRLPLDGGVP